MGSSSSIPSPKEVAGKNNKKRPMGCFLLDKLSSFYLVYEKLWIYPYCKRRRENDVVSGMMGADGLLKRDPLLFQFVYEIIIGNGNGHDFNMRNAVVLGIVRLLIAQLQVFDVTNDCRNDILYFYQAYSPIRNDSLIDEMAPGLSVLSTRFIDHTIATLYAHKVCLDKTDKIVFLTESVKLRD